MSIAEKLKNLETPKVASSILTWFSDLSESDKSIVWDALEDKDLKNYTLFDIFKSEGLKCSKDTFIPFRKSVLAGTITRSDLNVSK